MIPALPDLKQAFPGATLLRAVTSLPAAAQEYPNAVQSLIARGGSMEACVYARGGMTGHIGLLQGCAVSFCLTSDKEYVVVGIMIDADGQNISEARIQELVIGPQTIKAKTTLEDAGWIRDGETGMPVILYTFTHPDCHRFRVPAKPWLNAEIVQLRYILVGMERRIVFPRMPRDWARKIRQLLWLKIGAIEGREGQQLTRTGPTLIVERVKANSQLMSSVGLNTTPSFYYRDSDDGALLGLDSIHVQVGVSPISSVVK